MSGCKEEMGKVVSCLLQFVPPTRQSRKDLPPVRLSLSAVEQCFSLTAKQPQPAYNPKKQPAEQGLNELFLQDRSKVISSLSEEHWNRKEHFKELPLYR
jgi:hypothetical protein